MLASEPLVSIIIPTYNRAHLIAETLDSVLAQTYTNWECIIVDDGSTDNTETVVGAYVAKDSRFKYYHRPPEHLSGGNGARNYGFKMSKGDYVNWFDSDDLMHFQKLNSQITALENDDCDFSVCQSLVFEKNKLNILGLWHEKIISSKPLEDFIQKNIVFSTPSPILKINFLKKLNITFDEKLKSSQEWEFFCRLLYYSPIYNAVDTPLVYIRKHKDSTTHNSNKIKIRKYNYIKSRIKVFQFLRKNGVIHKNHSLYSYFKNFFIRKLNDYIFAETKKAFFLYNCSLYYYHNFFQIILVYFYFTFVYLTGKGYNYKDKFIK